MKVLKEVLLPWLMFGLLAAFALGCYTDDDVSHMIQYDRCAHTGPHFHAVVLVAPKVNGQLIADASWTCVRIDSIVDVSKP